MLVLVLPGCKTVPINPADASAPSVEFRVRGSDGQYKTQSSVNFQGAPIDAMAIAEDPQGIKALALQYVNTIANSCTVSSTLYNGSYSISVPQPVQQTLSGSNGKVLTKLPISASISGPFTCSVFNVGTGKPIGHVLRLRAVGTNWSSNSQTATATTHLDIKL